MRIAFFMRPDPADADAKRISANGIRDAALAAGKALGFEVYGVDFLRSPDTDEFWAVDVNAFPSQKGIESATDRIAEVLLTLAKR